ncbi:DUF3572 domain-containing protein [Yunchengibacter salinarum]|uniref:DUF3572 domain-containing protein n=1 Tax=Yunchengibacter salinarum TaxID=3133399 RepID=UPI0035B680F8
MTAFHNTNRSGNATLSMEQAEALALEAVGFIFAEDMLKDRFLDLSGLDAAAIRAQVQDRDFLASVLEFLVNFEPDLIAFSAHAGQSPGHVVAAWRRLGGGAGQEW